MHIWTLHGKLASGNHDASDQALQQAAASPACRHVTHILTLPSSPADSSRWPCLGKKRMALTPLVWPDQVCTQRLGR